MFQFNFPFFNPYNQAPQRFQATYLCHSMVVANRSALESGGKIILPQSALQTLTSLRIDYPMLFEVQNPENRLKTHCGVLEFVAEEGVCYLPFWMMNLLNLEEGSIVTISNTRLPLGTFTKLQPHTSDFHSVYNPKAVLEKALRSYATLTKGDSIKVNYLDKDYLFDVLEVKPETPAQAISIVEADVQVDFAPPLDYVEPVPEPVKEPVEAKPVEKAPSNSNLTFSGQYFTLSGKPPKNYNPPKPVPEESKPAEPAKPPSDQIVFQTRDLRSSSQNSLRTSEGLTSSSADANLRSSSQSNLAKKRRKRGEPIEQPAPEPKKTFTAFSGTGFSLKSGENVNTK